MRGEYLILEMTYDQRKTKLVEAQIAWIEIDEMG